MRFVPTHVLTVARLAKKKTYSRTQCNLCLSRTPTVPTHFRRVHSAAALPQMKLRYGMYKPYQAVEGSTTELLPALLQMEYERSEHVDNQCWQQREFLKSTYVFRKHSSSCTTLKQRHVWQRCFKSWATLTVGSSVLVGPHRLFVRRADRLSRLAPYTTALFVTTQH